MEVVTAACAQNGEALEYASLARRADREVVLVAVRENGFALEYAADELRANREVVRAAIEQSATNPAWIQKEKGSALKFAAL